MNRFSTLLPGSSLTGLLLVSALLCWQLTCQPMHLRAETITAPLAESPRSEQQAMPESAADSSAVPQVQPLPQNPATAAPPPVRAAPAAEGLRDIKGPVEIVNKSLPLLIGAATGAALILLGLLVFWWKRNKKQLAVLAHETALRQLAEADKLIEEQRINAFVTLIDQTLRQYIEQRFAISARRQTTREFITRLTADSKPVPQQLKDNSENLKTWLEHCDLVKFARAGLSREKMREMVTNLHTFIESTAMEPEQAGTAQKEAEK